jgi:uncharacterized protein (DUF1778 family)
MPKPESAPREPEEQESSRLNLRLSPEARAAIHKIAAKLGGISAAEVIRRAVSTELFLIEEQEQGSRVLIEDKNNRIRQLVLR